MRLLKRLARRFIPDALMARLRLQPQSRGARINVDVVAPSAAARRRWLRTTPDTYRVGRPAVGDPATDPGVVVVVGDAGADTHRLLAEVAASGRPAAVLGETDGAALVDGLRSEPVVAASAVAVRAAALQECGPLPGPPHAAGALFERLRAGGHPYVLVPVAAAGARPHRTDPISRPAAVMMSLVPMHDVGGGSRPAQLARVLLTSGFHVTFVHAYPSYESIDTGLRYLHPCLEEVPAGRFDPDALLARLGDPGAGLAVVAAPVPQLAGKAARLRAAGFTAVYDMIDNWSAGSLGGDWYREGVEAELVAGSDLVTAVTDDLVQRGMSLGGAPTLLPNGVDVDVFGSDPGPVPPDFPPGDGPVVGYHGSLWADWFDWDGVAKVADADPARRVILIGDHRGRRPVDRDNVHYLGLKPQAGLAPYVARFHAGLLPRRVEETTHAMSPLKVYEYLAAGVPVAAPPLRSLAGLAGVFVAADLAVAVEAALAAPRPDPAPVRAGHSWRARGAALLDLAGLEPGGTTDPARAVVRPAVHYPPRERRLGKGARLPAH